MSVELESKWFHNAIKMRPKRLDARTTAWNGHIPFAAWVTAVCRPKVLVELGTHLGISFAAFCQAARAYQTGTVCNAVDTWQGEQHAGRYDNSVYREVSSYFRKNYPDAKLLRMTFDEALTQFADGSVDLLHIDGLHTYEAVKHDFETWLPKMSPRGVILFHDTAVHDRTFGVWKLWAELRERYSGVEFSHSRGLGVLFLDPNMSPFVASLIKESDLGTTSPVLRMFETIGSEILAPPARRTLRTAVQESLNQATRIWNALPAIVEIGGGPLSTVKKAARILGTQGLKGVRYRILVGEMRTAKGEYDAWWKKYDTLTVDERARICAQIRSLKETPLFSLLLRIDRPDRRMLGNLLESIERQLYPHWQLIVCGTQADKAAFDAAMPAVNDNGRIQFVDCTSAPEDGLNIGLAACSGQFLTFIGQHDVLAEHGLFLIAKRATTKPELRVVFSDEDQIDVQDRRKNPYFKPEFDPDLMLGHDLLTGLTAYRTDIVREIGNLRADLKSAATYDFALRFIERCPQKAIEHIPRVLYHVRQSHEPLRGPERLVPPDREAARRAVSEHFSRTGRSASAELTPTGLMRVRFAVPSPAPLVSILIPTRNGLALLRQCIDSVKSRSTYPSYEVIVIDNGSDDPATLKYLTDLEVGGQARIIRDDGPFNYSRLNNRAVGQARGDLVCLLNNDVEVITPDWLEEMVGLAVRSDIGCVGACLWYPNDRLQHGGVLLSVRGAAAHASRDLPRGETGANDRAALLQSFSAVTAACLVVRKALYEQVGGLDEEGLTVGYGDVDLCLKIRAAGFRNLWTPHAELYHHEFATRGTDLSGPNGDRHFREVRTLRERWREIVDNDPCYSPNLTLEREDFSLAWPPRVGPL